MGEQTEETLKPSEKMAIADKWLDDYESRIGLPAFSEAAVSKKIGEYLSYTPEQFQTLSPMECAEISAVITQSSFHIQRCYNREVAHVTWANDVLRLGVAGKTANYRGSFLQQEHQAIKEDDYLSKISRIRTFAQQRVDRLSFLANTLHKFAEKLENLQVEKARKA